MPTVLLSDRFVMGAKPPARGQTVFWDTDRNSPTGFGVRIAPGGAKTWVLCYRSDCRKRWMTLGAYPAVRLKAARERAIAAASTVSEGRDPASERRESRARPTFGTLAGEYMERHAKAKKRSWRHDEGMLRKDLLPAFEHRKAADVSRRDVIELLDAIVDRGAGVQANRTLGLLRKMYNFGVARGLVETNPCHLVTRPALERQRDRVLGSAELRAVWAALDADPGAMADAHRLRIITLQRGIEVLTARWDEIDLEESWWTIPSHRAKNALAHRVPLTELALEILERRRHYRSSSPWVFPSPQKAHRDAKDGDPTALAGERPMRFSQSMNRRLRASSAVEFQPHDFRRTGASVLASMGVPRLVIKKLLNHVETDVTAVYDRHSYDSEKRFALEMWDRRVRAILFGAEGASDSDAAAAGAEPANVLAFVPAWARSAGGSP